MSARVLKVAVAVERDLADLEARMPGLASSALAATALALARELDKPKNSATSKSMCAKSLSDVLEELRALAPPKREADRLDDVAAKRAERRRAAGDPAA